MAPKKDQKPKIKDQKQEEAKVSESPLTSKIKTPSGKEPETMEELLSMTGYTLRGFQKNDMVTGVITSVNPKEITVDIGGKTDAVVISREMEFYKDILLTLKPGDKVTGRVILSENEKGQPVISLRQDIVSKRWDTLKKFMEEGVNVDIIIREPVRGGVLVEYGGLRGYIPQSHLEPSVGKQLEKSLGRTIQVKVIEVDVESNRLVFSQRAVSESANLAKQKELLSFISIEGVYDAVVTGVVPFGAFAKIKVDKEGQTHELEGLIHISEIAWEKVEDPNVYLKINDTIKIKVIGIDEKTGKLTFSIKQLLPDPWEDVREMFEKDQKISGKIARITQYGLFVTLSPGIEGLVHISKIAPDFTPKVGDEITCTIEEVSPEKRKISLSIALTEKPMGYR